MTLSVILLFAFLAISASLEIAETSLLAADEVRLQTLVRKGDKRALLVVQLRADMRGLLGTLLLGMTLCDVAASAIATILAHDLFGDAAVSVAIGIMTLVVLIVVKIIPKSFAIQHPERWARRAARPVALLQAALFPVVSIVNVIVDPFFRKGGAGRHAAVTEEEIKTLTSMGVKAGAVEGGEKELIERVFLFNDITAGDVLTPKEIVAMLEADRSVAEVLPIISASGFSRFPIYREDPDTIIGIVHIKDIFAKFAETPPVPLETIVVRDLAHPPVFVPETERIDDLFREFKKQHVHMAIVINDQKTVVGLVTLEDLIEELVGEISDETDIDEDIIKRVDKHTVLVHGDIELPYVNRFFNTHLESAAQRTVGRLIVEKFGKLPKQGQEVPIADNIVATVEQISRGRIIRARLVKQEP